MRQTTFTVRDLQQWSSDAELLVEVIMALEEGGIIQQETVSPARTWRKVKPLDMLRGVVPAER